MTQDANLKAELVEFMQRGGTVAELLRHARTYLGEEAPQRDWIEAVRSAFGLPLGGWTVIPATESFGTGRVPDSMLTWAFLPAMLANRDKWDEPDDAPRWFDGVEKASRERLRELAETSHGISPEGWAGLSECDREKILRTEMTHLSLYDDVRILAALAEQLQRRVNELEGRHEQLNHHPAAAGAA